MKVGIKTISELSGFSIATVSNVLNNKGSISRDTKEKVLQIAHEVGYIGKEKISSIKLVIYKKHGQVVGDTPFFSSLIEGIESACRMYGFQMEICNIYKSSESDDELLYQILHDQSTAILLLATELLEDDIAIFENSLAPLLVLDSWYPKQNFSSVAINNIDSVKNAVEYLINKGHKEIGHIKSSYLIQNFREREHGFLKALELNDISRNGSYDISLTPTMDGAYRDMKNFLQSHHVELPTAFFADNDILALGAMKALQENGVRIPQDVSIIGFDDLPFCEISTPSLTTIKVDKEQMGNMTVKMLIDFVIKGDYYPFRLSVSTEFIERKSVSEPHSYNGPDKL